MERVATYVVAATTAFFALAAAWELFGPLPGGHFGNAAGTAMGGENMLKWRFFAAVLEETVRRPTPAQYNVHHPYGMYLTQALSHALVGHGWVAVRLPGVVLSALTPPLVYLTARALWGALPGAVATLAFALTPIDLAFASFSSLEVHTIFFGLIFSWATLRLWSTWRTRYVWLAALGALGACQSDWIGMVLVGATLLFAFARAYVLPEAWFGRIDHRQHARWFAWATAAVVGTLVLYLSVFAAAHQLADLLDSYGVRTEGNDKGFADVFGQRRIMWLLFMLPAPALCAIAFGVPAWIARAATGLIGEAVPLAWFAAACVQYFVFRGGADVHIFWPHYFGPVFALTCGALARVALALPVDMRWGERASKLLGRGPVRLLEVGLPLAPFAFVFVLVGRVGLVQLRQAHLTGGRFDDGGRYIGIEQDRNQFAEWATSGTPLRVPIGFHPSFERTLSAEYAAHRPVFEVPRGPPPEDGPRRILVDARQCSAGELRALARSGAVDAVGPFWRLAIDRPATGPRALAYREREPSGVTRYAVTGTDLVRSIGPEEDPWASWEWGHHLGFSEPPPALPPRTAEEARVAHNVARLAGDHDAAEALAARALVGFDTSMHADFTKGVHLLGVRIERGPAIVVSLLWRTDDDLVPDEEDFVVRSRVLAPPPLWASAIDYFEKDVAPPMALRPALWRPGHLYAQRFVVMRRVGVESFEGEWSSPDGDPRRPVAGGDRVSLFTLR